MRYQELQVRYGVMSLLITSFGVEASYKNSADIFRIIRKAHG